MIMRPFDKLNDLQETLKQIATTTNARYDGKLLRKGQRSFNVQLLKNPDYATNYNARKQTLYVSPSDVRMYSKLKQFIQRM